MFVKCQRCKVKLDVQKPDQGPDFDPKNWSHPNENCYEELLAERSRAYDREMKAAHDAAISRMETYHKTSKHNMQVPTVMSPEAWKNFTKKTEEDDETNEEPVSDESGESSE